VVDGVAIFSRQSPQAPPTTSHHKGRGLSQVLSWKPQCRYQIQSVEAYLQEKYGGVHF
jgi:hypothetical protein